MINKSRGLPPRTSYDGLRSYVVGGLGFKASGSRVASHTAASRLPLIALFASPAPFFPAKLKKSRRSEPKTSTVPASPPQQKVPYVKLQQQTYTPLDFQAANTSVTTQTILASLKSPRILRVSCRRGHDRNHQAPTFPSPTGCSTSLHGSTTH